MNQEDVQAFGTFVFGSEFVMHLFVGRETIPNLTLVLVTQDVVPLDEPAENDGEGGDADKREISPAVVRFVAIGVDTRREDRADLDRHVVETERHSAVSHRLRVL